MDASRKLARSAETSNVPAICTNDAGVQVELEATHAKMTCWRDAGGVESLRLHGRARNDIMTKLFSTSERPDDLVGCGIVQALSERWPVSSTVRLNRIVLLPEIRLSTSSCTESDHPRRHPVLTSCCQGHWCHCSGTQRFQVA